MRLTAEISDDGTRLDAYLARRTGSRSRAQRLIDAGAVTVDGRSVVKSHVVRAGETIVLEVDPEPRAPADLAATTDVPIVWEDEHLLVVDKPAGLVVHPAPAHPHGTLAQILQGRAAGGEYSWRAGIVHRLDRDTSGLLVVAKTDAVHQALKEAIQRREVRREYLALVDGRPPSRSGTIDAPIGRDRRRRTRISTDTDEPRSARTDFVIDRELPTTTLLRVNLQTGRTHQIRVHLQAIGHPVCGDPDYGGKGVLGLTRQFLHAARLTFDHPVTGTVVDITSELPADLAEALVRAGEGPESPHGSRHG